MTRELVRCLVAYVVAIALLTFYGGRVCPLIDSLGLGRLAAILAGCFAVGLAMKAMLLMWLRPQDRDGRSSPWSFFAFDLGHWVAIAVVFAVLDWFVFGFPFWTSGMKMAVGTFALGFYASAFDALQHERELIELAAKGDIGRSVAGPPLNTAQRFFWFTAGTLVVMSGVLLLLLYKDLVMEEIPFETTRAVQESAPADDSVAKKKAMMAAAAPTPEDPMAAKKAMMLAAAAAASQTPEDPLAAKKAMPARAHTQKEWVWAIFKEVLFVLAILIAGTIVVTRQYASNLRRMFELEQLALDAVKGGRFDVRVPVVSRDEFSEIADGTNGMIEGLREKEKYRSILGMVVSPTVAKRILAREGMLGGDSVTATILFSDLRDYTSVSEKLSPERMVTLLNEYFTMVNRVIEKNGGFVNKYIGDAVMAIFGLDEPAGSCEQAVRAALEIRVELLVLNKRLAERGFPMIENGIGIHHGPVIAGVIGAKERVEFTVIGDTVNTASRLESLTKNLSSFVATSRAVYDAVSEETRRKMEPAGEHVLKGKADKFPVYGMSEASRPSRW